MAEQRENGILSDKRGISCTGPGGRQGRNLTAVESNKGNYFYDSSPVL